MKRGFTTHLVFAALAGVACLALAPALSAQAADGGTPPAGQAKPAAGTQNPPPAPSDTNAFPVNTDSIPVMPNKETVDRPPGSFGDAGAGRIPLPNGDLDPVRSPDDGLADPASSGESSSNSPSLDSLLPSGDDTPPGKRKKNGDNVEAVHVETAAEDLSVGKYYLDQKNWKAALSRLQSAMVLDPENPEVYWGLAESSRHLGDLASARAYYEKVAEFDPGSKHAKEAIKALKDPEIANAKAPAPGQAENKTP